jgi:hypothetical protein
MRFAVKLTGAAGECFTAVKEMRRIEGWSGFFALRNSVPVEELEQFNPRPVPLTEERANPLAGWKQ